MFEFENVLSVSQSSLLECGSLVDVLIVTLEEATQKQNVMGRASVTLSPVIVKELGIPQPLCLMPFMIMWNAIGKGGRPIEQKFRRRKSAFSLLFSVSLLFFFFSIFNALLQYLVWFFLKNKFCERFKWHCSW